MSEMRKRIFSRDIPGDKSNSDLMVNALVAIAEELRSIAEELHHTNTHGKNKMHGVVGPQFESLRADMDKLNSAIMDMRGRLNDVVIGITDGS